jgi:hypothetical protein
MGSRRRANPFQQAKSNARRRLTRAENKAGSAIMLPIIGIAIVWALLAKLCG